MHYICRRGHPDRKQFCDILLEDLMPDGGLYVPEAYPRVDDGTLGRWLSCSILAPQERPVGIAAAVAGTVFVLTKVVRRP
jgi:threonine synthase